MHIHIPDVASKWEREAAFQKPAFQKPPGLKFDKNTKWEGPMHVCDNPETCECDKCARNRQKADDLENRIVADAFKEQVPIVVTLLRDGDFKKAAENLRRYAAQIDKVAARRR